MYISLLNSFTSLDEISKGDYIVHAIHGIGVFDGIKTMNMSGVIKDFLKINYRGSDVLYVPAKLLWYDDEAIDGFI